MEMKEFAVVQMRDNDTIAQHMAVAANAKDAVALFMALDQPQIKPSDTFEVWQRTHIGFVADDRICLSTPVVTIASNITPITHTH
jgi:hypothetical protein